jgi:hypothetical protein
MLLSNGVDAIGLVSIARWKQILARAWRGGCLLGVDERAFPRDFASFVRHHTDLEARVPVRSPAPPLSIDVFEELMHEVASDDRVRWQEHAA